jgi:EAL domain-containing protein (putative c-di-GMP-specific phosphodiesterase class I)
MSEPTPSPGSHLKVVSLLDPGGLADRLSAHPEQIQAAFSPIADLSRACAAGYEVLLGIEGETPQPLRVWSQVVHARQAGMVEAPLLQAALDARDELPEGTFMAVSLSVGGLLSPEFGRVIESAGRMESVVLVLADDTHGAEMFAVRRALDAAREAGATVAVDEPGSGYTSLQHVLRLKPDYVRVGSDFVQEVDRDAAKAAVVETLASLASRIDAWVIASGISATGELDTLARLGIQLGQGPLIGGPQRRCEPLPGAAASAIRGSAPVPGPEETVAALIEAQPTVPWDASVEVLADAFLEDARNDVLVLVDERHRPLALADRASLMRGEPFERPLMRIGRSSPMKAVARRAAARSALERFDPLVVCDRRGGYIGIVRVEKLLDTLAR